MDEVKGKITRVFKDSAGWAAGRIRTESHGDIGFAGSCSAAQGAAMVLYGKITEHPTYGTQIQVQNGHLDMSFDGQGLIDYLADEKRFNGVGPVRAKTLVEEFGVAGFEEVVSKDWKQLARIPGITEEIAESLHKEWVFSRAVNSLIVAFRTYGLNHQQSKNIVYKFGVTAVNFLEKDPYRLIDAAGLGFRQIDAVERSRGTKKNDVRRIAGAVVAALQNANSQNGSTLLALQDAIPVISQMAGVPVLLEAVRQARDYRLTVKQQGFVLEQNGLMLFSLYNAETDFCNWLKKAKKHASQLSKRHSIKDVEVPEGLTKGQAEVFRQCLVSSVTFVYGRAGTGKTHSVRMICDLYAKAGCTIRLLAPTGKAAQHLSASTGREASTIHRAVIKAPQGTNIAGEPLFTFSTDPFVDDLIVVDEISMIDSALMAHLIRKIDLGQTSVIFLGDSNQLVPVGPGQPAMDVFRVVHNSGGLSVCSLNEVVRQTGKLAQYCVNVLDGYVRASTDYAEGWVLRETHNEVQSALLDLYGESWLKDYDHFADVQILTAMNKGVLGVHELNVLLQQYFQTTKYGVLPDMPEEAWKVKILPGDKVIQTKNDYSIPLYNGDTGIVLEIVEDDYHPEGIKKGSIRVDFEGDSPIWLLKNGGASSSDQTKNLRLAYALTVHKAQGSEYPVVVVIADKSQSQMLTRSWFYTAVTRGKKTVCILGQHSTAQKASKTLYAFNGTKRSTLTSNILFDWFTGGL